MENSIASRHLELNISLLNTKFAIFWQHTNQGTGNYSCYASGGIDLDLVTTLQPISDVT